MNNRSAALAYARHGWRVLALEVGGKRPLARWFPHGVKDATADLGTLARCFDSAPAANLGLAIPDELVVLDVDVRNDGPATLASWVARWGALPRTPHQVTASGGDHFVFRRPAGVGALRCKLGAGVELLGGGRYIVTAPSEIGAGRYAWDVRLSAVVPAELPIWVLDLALEAPAAPPAPPSGERASSSVLDRARAYLAKRDPAVSGQGGHSHTFLTAQKLVLGFGLSEDEALVLMTEWNKNCCPPWSPAALRRKIREASTKGRMGVGALRDARGQR